MNPPHRIPARAQSQRSLVAGMMGATALAALASPVRAADDAAAAAAAPGLDDAAVSQIVVTARHRSEDSQKVPIALTVLGGALLAKTDTTGIAQVSQFVPSIQFTFFNARNANINVRGLGANVGLASDGLEPGVGFYVDQVYYDRPAAATFELADVDRIEVLRGPQGTLFGKNTTAGAISITSAAPSFKPEASLELTGGDYGLFQTKAQVSGPLIDGQLAGRLSLASSTREGTVTNLATGDKVNGYLNLTARGQVLWVPTSDLKVRLIADYSKQDANCCDLVLAGAVLPPNGKNFVRIVEGLGYTPLLDPFARKADTNSKVQARQETGGISLQTEWSLPKAVVTSITAWRFWNWWPSNDSDYTPLSALTYSQNADAQNQLSQELRIASTGVNRVDYVAGLYYFRGQVDARILQQFGDAGSAFFLGAAVPSAVASGYSLTGAGSFNTTSYAAFGQATWHVTSRLSLTGGLRYTYDDKNGRFDQVASGGVPLTGALAAFAPYRLALGRSVAFSIRDGKGDVSGQANIAYQVTSDVLAYATYARGFKSGGLNLTQLPAGVSPVVAPESIDSYEVGLKTRLLDGHVTLNADGFWQEDSDYQANITDPATAKQYLSNIPKVRSRGFELDAQAQPIDGLSLYASATWDEATYISYADAPCGLEHVNQPHCDLSGRPLGGTPRWAASAGGEYSHGLALGPHEAEAYAGVDYSYRSSLFSAATDSIYSRLPALTLVNARLGLRSRDGRWDADIWAKNLFDVDYFSFIGAGVGNTGALTALPGDPRTFGVTVRARY